MKVRFGSPTVLTQGRSVVVDRMDVGELLVRADRGYVLAGPRRVVQLTEHAVLPEPVLSPFGFTHSAMLYDGALLLGTKIAAKGTMNGRLSDALQYGQFALVAIENATGDPVHFIDNISGSTPKNPFCISSGIIRADISARVWLFATYPLPYSSVPSTNDPNVLVWGLP